MGGKLVGERSILNLKPRARPGGAPFFRVPVPAGQAVLLVTSGQARRGGQA